MKKVLLLFICISLLVGCGKEDKVDTPKIINEEFVLEKADKDKEYVYFNNYKEVTMSTGTYVYKYPVINIKSDEIDNLNLELKNFVVRSYKDAGIYNGYLNSGNVVDFKYYVTDEYVSIVKSYYYYIDGMIGEYSDDIYVVSLDNGKIISNDEILKDYNMSEEEFFDLLESKLDTEDIAYSLRSIKDNGYSLYIDNDSKLWTIFYEVTDEEEIRKELVLN